MGIWDNGEKVKSQNGFFQRKGLIYAPNVATNSIIFCRMGDPEHPFHQTCLTGSLHKELPFWGAAV